MYAVIETGGKQLRVSVGDVVRLERVKGDPGSEVVFDRVLMLDGGGGGVKLGAPALEGARVRGSVVEQGRQAKVLIYTYKRRNNSNRKRGGHRQYYTAVKIEAIEG
jgi:large subunit ribosomal protein L21